MRNAIQRTSAAALLLGIFATTGFWAKSSSGQQQDSSPQTTPATQPAGGGASVHAITLPTFDTNLPDGPGRQLVQANCSICHSVRYITMQPHFSRTTWTNEVQKMITAYGAPVPQQQVEEIVKYLVSVRGLEQVGT